MESRRILCLLQPPMDKTPGLVSGFARRGRLCQGPILRQRDRQRKKAGELSAPVCAGSPGLPLTPHHSIHHSPPAARRGQKFLMEHPVSARILLPGPERNRPQSAAGAIVEPARILQHTPLSQRHTCPRLRVGNLVFHLPAHITNAQQTALSKDQASPVFQSVPILPRPGQEPPPRISKRGLLLSDGRSALNRRIHLHRPRPE